MIGTYNTKNGLSATVTQYAPRVRQYFGFVRIKGLEKETLWNTEGMNLENPDWDLELKDPLENALEP